ncbi:MAG: hypothetical protein KKH41_03385 [Candidatus Thermoplasmatota archaeon]|nr:hypothetical protein [Euryarchaeota archaeon]MBU4031876.1 hypothetical protein [Candidatus Thermoplasmatota archaeon]MBU4071438.1 hypothetical protein [Candidatus Thermoplasmatota archaeon]MBU4143824.1 hypothetical protein [Candidatus Thermoplasmatota archaeon]MBU4591609.1 hypothetical protein [Candidatus Thermoplasmatota archaeon]
MRIISKSPRIIVLFPIWREGWRVLKSALNPAKKLVPAFDPNMRRVPTLFLTCNAKDERKAIHARSA